jgi:hypothetical protein
MIGALFDMVNVVARDTTRCACGPRPNTPVPSSYLAFHKCRIVAARTDFDRAFTGRINIDRAFTGRENIDRTFTGRKDIDRTFTKLRSFDGVAAWVVWPLGACCVTPSPVEFCCTGDAA